MKRLAVMAVVLAAACTAAAALPAGTAQLRPGQAAAAECVWKRHAKRVVKRVRRHGKVRKVVRWRPRRVCFPQAVPPVVTTPAPAPSAPAPASPEPEPEANRLSVTAKEFYYGLSRPSVKPGEVTIELNNQGEDPHNLNVRLEGDEGAPRELPETASKQRSVATFDLPAGKYRLWCSLPEHEENGMHATLVVE